LKELNDYGWVGECEESEFEIDGLVHMDVETFQRVLHEEAQTLWVGTSVDRIQTPTTAEDVARFVQRYVGASRPVILLDMAAHWPAMRTWVTMSSSEFLCRDTANNEQWQDKHGTVKVSVNVTPDGGGDKVYHFQEDRGQDHERNQGGTPEVKSWFVKPLEERWRWTEVLSQLERDSNQGVRGGEIVYLSAQNDNLRNEMPHLLNDIDEVPSLVKLAFGTEPEAVNLWLGGPRSVSSLHKEYVRCFRECARSSPHMTSSSSLGLTSGLLPT